MVLGERPWLPQGAGQEDTPAPRLYFQQPCDSLIFIFLFRAHPSWGSGHAGSRAEPRGHTAQSVRSETCLVTNQAQQAPGKCRRVSSDLFGGEEVTRAPGRGSSRYTLTLHRRLFTLSEMFYSRDQVLEMGEDVLAPCSSLALPCCNRGALQALGRAQGRLLLNR